MGESPKYARMFSLNCQGPKAHWDTFNELLKTMSNDNTSSFDIIGITELYSTTDGDCTLNGYHPITYKIRNDTPRSRGGVGMYIQYYINIYPTYIGVFIC